MNATRSFALPAPQLPRASSSSKLGPPRFAPQRACAEQWRFAAFLAEVHMKQLNVEGELQLLYRRPTCLIVGLVEIGTVKQSEK